MHPIHAYSFGNVVAHGVDAVDLADFAGLIQRLAGGYLDRYFTDEEIKVAGDHSTRLERLASRFATKEAVLKALGTGWGDGIAFTDVEVVTQETGATTIELHRNLIDLAGKKGITTWLVSATHTRSVAIASVIGLRANNVTSPM